MPDMGKPQGIVKNPFRNIKMAAQQAGASHKKTSLGDQLNKIAGNQVKSGVKYVDGKKGGVILVAVDTE